MFFSIQNVRSQSFIFFQSRCMLVSNKQEANNPRTQTKPKTELSLHLKSRLRVKMEVEVKTLSKQTGTEDSAGVMQESNQQYHKET